VAGGASRSYGIQVARLAGLPEAVIARAREVLAELESPAAAPGAGGRRRSPQLSLFAAPAAGSAAPPAAGEQRAAGEAERAVLDELRSLDPDRVAPLDALLALQRWRTRLAGERS